jgi:excisionase family DNA binding protein
MPAILQDEWLSPSQAANRLGLSVQRVRQLVDCGRLGHIATPLGRLVAAEDVARVARERAERRGTEPPSGGAA